MPIAFFSMGRQFWFTLHNITQLLDIRHPETMPDLDSYLKFWQWYHNNMMLNDELVIIIAKSLEKWEFLQNFLRLLKHGHDNHEWHPYPSQEEEYRQNFAKAAGIPIEKIWPNKPYEFHSLDTLLEKEIDTPPMMRCIKTLKDGGDQ